MDLLSKQGIISEMECKNNLAYILNDNSMFLVTEYKVLQSHAESGFLKCMKLLYNGKIQLYYIASEYEPLLSMLGSLDENRFFEIASHIFSNILMVKSNGFLSCTNININLNRIFVDPVTCKVAFVYLPISKGYYSNDSEFENELRISLVKVISASSWSSPKMLRFAAALSDGKQSMTNLLELLRGGKSIPHSIPTPLPKARRMRLVAVNAPGNLEIPITKACFTIGKNEAVVDGAITFNNAISRVHCQITQKNGEYAITDLKSANGTQVNRVKLTPNQPCALKNGDMIRLANSDFQVIIS